MLTSTSDPFAEADEDTGEAKQSQNYIHIRIQRTLSLPRSSFSWDALWQLNLVERNGRKTLTTVQGLPKKFDQKKILKVIKKKFGMLLDFLHRSRNDWRSTACNGTIVNDSEMGEVIQLQGDQRKDVQEFLVDKNGLELDAKTIKVNPPSEILTL
jgi:translation initiation factor 1 (eIF-1/SUI1)